MEVLAFLSVCLDVVMIVIATKEENTKSKDQEIGSVMFSLLGVFLMIWAYTEADEFIFIGFIIFCIGIVLQINIMKKIIKKRTAQKQESEINSKIAFYHECFENGINECQNEKEKQKATLIAQKRNLKFTDISSLFYEARDLTDRDKNKKQLDDLNKMKEKEKTECALLDKYSHYIGREKRIAMLSDERKEALSNAQKLQNAASTLIRTSQQKEHDWAILGGIADGIAGPGAGIATALNVQEKNMQIRAQNQENFKAATPMLMGAYSSVSDYKKQAEYLQKQIDNTKIKLVANESSSTCFDHIAFFDTKVEVSETGTCTITTKAKLKTPMIVFDDVDAIVDGTIIANIYEESKLVGSAKMVLPKYGIKEETKLKGMCLFCGNKNTKYRVEYIPLNLWAMEK